MSLAIKTAKYRGDPGLGSLLKKGLKIAGKFIPGAGAVSTAVDLLSARKRPAPLTQQHPTIFGKPVPGTIGFPAVPPGRSLPVPPGMGGGGGGGFGAPPPRVYEAPPPGGMQGRPAGMRLNKTSYFLRTGEFVPAGSRWVKIRRRNPLNPRALDRAMGRLISAQRASKKMQRIHFGPPHRRAAPARKRKR